MVVPKVQGCRTVYTYAMDRILRGGLQRPNRAVRLHHQLSGQESQEEPRSGTEGLVATDFSCTYTYVQCIHTPWIGF